MSGTGTTINLVNKVGSRYLANFLSYQIGQILEEIPDNTIVDLAGAKFGPEAFMMVSRYMRRLTFIDSENEELNAILKGLQSDVKGIYEPNMEVPVISTWDDIREYVKNFPHGKKYYKWPITTNRNAKYAMIAAMLSYPQYMFDISNMYVDIFQILMNLGAPTKPNPIHVNSDKPMYLTTEMTTGNYYSVSAIFLCPVPIDLDNPENHFFGKVIVNMQKDLQEIPYVSFVEVAREQLKF